MNTNETRKFQKPFATGQVPVRIQRQIIKLQNNDSLNNVSAVRNIEQIYGNTLEIFNALKTFEKNALTLHGDAYPCEQAFSVMKFRKIKFVSGLNDFHVHSKLRIYASRFKAFTSLFQGHTISEILLQRVKKERKGFTNCLAEDFYYGVEINNCMAFYVCETNVPVCTAISLSLSFSGRALMYFIIVVTYPKQVVHTMNLIVECGPPVPNDTDP
jgi:hypothetical protein